MTKTEIIKTVVGSMAAIGSGAIAAAYISNAPYAKSFRPLMKACVWIGGLAIEGIIGDKAAQYTDGLIDMAANAIQNLGIKVSIEQNVEPEEGVIDVETEDGSV